MDEAFKVPEFPLNPTKQEEAPTEPEIPYKVPKWLSLAKEQFSFEGKFSNFIVKNNSKTKLNSIKSSEEWRYRRRS